jgi:uncharacterized protein (TIGR00251 family)
MGQARLQIRLNPRSSRDRLAGREGDVWRVSLAAPPVDGQANQSLLRFLAKNLGLSPSSLTLAQGRASRRKLVLVDGLGQEELERRLEGLL